LSENCLVKVYHESPLSVQSDEGGTRRKWREILEPAHLIKAKIREIKRKEVTRTRERREDECCRRSAWNGEESD